MSIIRNTLHIAVDAVDLYSEFLIRVTERSSLYKEFVHRVYRLAGLNVDRKTSDEMLAMGAVMTRAGYTACAKACHKAIDSAKNLDEFYEGIGEEIGKSLKDAIQAAPTVQ